jgi:parallel beta-helix repeat protein
MKRTTLTTLVLTLMFLAVAGILFANLAFAEVIGPTAIEPPADIYIMSDGSVVGTDNIQHNGDIYTFIGNVLGTMVVRRDNIILDGAGYTLQGEGNRTPVIAGLDIYPAGIFLQSRYNVVIKNLVVCNFSRGIELSLRMVYNPGCQNITVHGNTITNNEIGILCRNSENNVFSGNIVTNNTYGISCSVSDNNAIHENTISRNDYGIGFYYSIDNIVYHNNFINNTRQALINRQWGMASTIFWDHDSLGNYWSNYVGSDINGDGVGNTPYIIDENNTDHYPLMCPWGAPSVCVVHPENMTYTADVPLNFTVSKPASWLGYSLDGQENITIAGNTTLSGLSSGLHNVTVYANDMFGNVGASETINFTVDKESEAFPTTLVAVPIVLVAIIGAGLMLYFTKIKKTSVETK